MKKLKQFSKHPEVKYHVIGARKNNIIETVGLFFYSVICITSLIFAILYSSQILLFYFFVCISIFSSIMVLWWGRSKTTVEIKKGHGAFLRLIYWLGFLAVLFYIYVFFSSAYNIAVISILESLEENIKMIILFTGLSLMFLSILTANLLYKEGMRKIIEEKTIEKEKQKKLEKKVEEKKQIEVKKEKIEENIEEPQKKEEKKMGREKIIETKLDELFNLLEENKSIKLSVIVKKFKITKEEAIDWCTVLSEHGLAELVYPTFGEPELRLK
ncbi:hypothetical protein HZA33_05650 [Candidatus Pacearchaeota archaeon]|nr:hypothetical protein [Candidatus Pacearchaeota archaeon]